MSLKQKLKNIRVLWRQSDTMSLWGIPYHMTGVAEPNDLFRNRNTAEWIWLGTPGWYGEYTGPEIAMIKQTISDLGEAVPQHPGEWSDIQD
jgi:hypothetical protein